MPASGIKAFNFRWFKPVAQSAKCGRVLDKMFGAAKNPAPNQGAGIWSLVQPNTHLPRMGQLFLGYLAHNHPEIQNLKTYVYLPTS